MIARHLPRTENFAHPSRCSVCFICCSSDMTWLVCAHNLVALKTIDTLSYNIKIKLNVFSHSTIFFILVFSLREMSAVRSSIQSFRNCWEARNKPLLSGFLCVHFHISFLLFSSKFFYLFRGGFALQQVSSRSEKIKIIFASSCSWKRSENIFANNTDKKIESLWRKCDFVIFRLSRLN